MKNKKIIIKNIIVSIIALIIVIISFIGLSYIMNKGNINQNVSAQVNISPETLENLKVFNQKLDDYYIQTWDENKFLSSYSYLVKNDGTEVIIDDIEQSLEYQVPEDLKDVSIHFVAPKALKPYLGDKILDEDPDILTVYSALPVNGGMYVSSKFDEGGFIPEEDYKQFVMEHSWVHGDIRTPSKDDKDYKEILKAVEKADKLLENGNVKHIACDDKYAIIVISSKDEPAYIKQYALKKNNNGSYDIIVEQLESLDSKVFINYKYTDFDLGLLPLYELSDYTNISSEQEYIIELLKENGSIADNEEVVYSCGAGNFICLEFKSNLKILLHSDINGKLNVYEVDNFKTALSQMLKLESNPPAFILNFE